jgi:regulator of replication initiation timing
MRINVVAMGIGVAGAVMLLAGCGRDEKLQETQQQLTTATNELAAARAEVVEVKTQMQVKVDELQQNISKLTAGEGRYREADGVAQGRPGAEAGGAAVEGPLARNGQGEPDDGVKSLNDQIADVNQKLADLTKTHAQTVSHLQAMREEYVKLTAEKAVLEAKLHDLKALKEQITVVKKRTASEEGRGTQAAGSRGVRHGQSRLFAEGRFVGGRTHAGQLSAESGSVPRTMTDKPQKLRIANRDFNSRLIMGTGKFASGEIMASALEASGAEMVTVALRRADLSGRATSSPTS